MAVTSSGPGASSRSRGSSSAISQPRKPAARENSTTPALTNSARSMRGTTRTTAYSNARRSGTRRLLQQLGDLRAPLAQPFAVGGSLRDGRGRGRQRRQPRVGQLGGEAGDLRVAERRAQPLARGRQLVRPGQQLVLANQR